jgi:hypothetical protein
MSCLSPALFARVIGVGRRVECELAFRLSSPEARAESRPRVQALLVLMPR